jgi:hypothetical protein
VFCGAVQFYFGDSATRRYATTSRAVTDCIFLLLSAAEFSVVFRRWYPMAVHLLNGMFVALHTTDELIGQRDRLAALGALAGGLTHELNNPAAAARRATAALQDRSSAVWAAWTQLVAGGASPSGQQALLGLRRAVLERGPTSERAGALALSDQEDVVADWLTDHGLPRSWELAAVFPPLGVGTGDLDAVHTAVGTAVLEPALRWLASAADEQALIGEIADATRQSVTWSTPSRSTRSCTGRPSSPRTSPPDWTRPW